MKFSDKDRAVRARQHGSQTNRTSMGKRPAFTLIELLVVIAIIAILAAILFPVFAQARSKARSAACLSNLKQLTLGFVMYSQDYDESFPQWKWDQSYSGGNVNPNDATSLWCNAIFPYVKNNGVYKCPEDARNLSANDFFGGWFNMATVKGFPESVARSPISYGANEPVTYNFPAIASMAQPASTMIIADMINPLSGWEGWDAYNPDNQNDPKNKWRIQRIAYSKSFPGWGDQYWQGPFNPAWDSGARHGGGNNIGFADGHVKYLQVGRTTVDLYGTKLR
jgi:prepilin-type N-terminal cleavage/methylation domain-containing protein/prepilin-type processing-associated H-X9-DG protein